MTPSWDDKNLALELRACDVCGKSLWMRSEACFKCRLWAQRCEWWARIVLSAKKA
jgi:hypothetical protein